MLLKSQLDNLIQFMESQARILGVSPSVINQISMETAANLRFTFPSHTSQLELIRRVTKEVASFSAAFTEEDLEDIGLAIDEACTNVITHSYRATQKGVIQVEITMEADKITIELTDKGEEGQLFNPEALSDVDKDEYLMRLQKGGLGVHLIKKIMDVVEYTVSPGVKNCLKMIKYIRPVTGR